jgi:5-formyltetrahydrofolate cyclo-ligase
LPADPAETALQDEKRALRRRARAARAAAADGAAATVLRDRFVAEVAPAPAAVVSGYWPLGDELDPRPLMAALAGRGHRLALPAIVAAGQPLIFRAWREGEPLIPAGFGTREPGPEAGVLRPDLLLVPLLAFDAQGFRLGYGGGFYDRSLAILRAAGDILAVGLAYAAQQVAAVPREPTDQPLDLVVTERGVIRPTRQ